MKKFYYFLFITFLTSGLLFYMSCTKKDVESCTDGIQNQDETGVDCGGPCTACNKIFLCTGNSANNYFPLNDENKWVYELTAGVGDYYWVIDGTDVYDSKTYYVLEWYYGSMHWATLYYRIDSNGDVYEYFDGTEYLYLPANPVINQEWTYGSGTRKVMSITESKVTSFCSYTDLLLIGNIDSYGTESSVCYFKKGLGMVNDPGMLNYELAAVILN